MRYPYNLFLKFLISRKADVNATLEGFGLPELDYQDELEKREFLNSARPPAFDEYFDSEDTVVKSKEGFLEWAEAHEIREMWEIQPEFRISDERQLTRGSEGMKKACEVFSDPEKRTALSLLVIRAFDFEDIAELFQQKFNYILTKDAYALAIKYFFDFTAMRQEDWRNLMDGADPNESTSLHLALQPTSNEFIQHNIGAIPSLSYDEILQDIMVSSYYKFKACEKEPLMDMLAMKWAQMAMKAGELKKKYGKGDKIGLMDNLQMRFDFTQPQFPTLEELATTEQDGSKAK